MMKRDVLVGMMLVAATASAVAGEPGLTIREYAERLYASSESQILDVRSADEYAVNHLENAVNVDLSDSLGTERIIASLNPDAPVFTYSIREGRSALLAERLKGRGFREVYYMPGGMAGWVGAGYPLCSFVDESKFIPFDRYRSMVASEKVLLVDFSSKHCGSCRRLHALLDELEAGYGDTVRIVRIEFDENPDLVRELGIKALPTLYLYCGGETVWEHTGLVSKEEIDAAVRARIGGE